MQAQARIPQVGDQILFSDRRKVLKGLGAAAVLAALPVAATRPASGAGRGLAFISNEKGHTVTVLDIATLEIVKQIKTSRRPRGMVFNLAKTLLYVGLWRRRRGGRHRCRSAGGGGRHSHRP